MILTLKSIVEHADFADFIWNLAYKEYDSVIIIWNNGKIRVWKTISTAYDSLQFSSVAQSCLTLWDPMNRSTPGLPVHHQLPEFTQTHVHRVCDAIQHYHPLLSFSSRPQSFPASGRVFSNEAALGVRWPKYWSFSFNISPSNEHLGLISFWIE